MIEQVLQAHPEVLEAAVIAIPHDVDDEHPIAFVVKIPHAEVSMRISTAPIIIIPL